MGAPNGFDAFNSAFTASASACCAGGRQKIAERYCVPTSLPWRLSWAGSWRATKTSSRSRCGITPGPKQVYTASA